MVVEFLDCYFVVLVYGIYDIRVKFVIMVDFLIKGGWLVYCLDLVFNDGSIFLVLLVE